MALLFALNEGGYSSGHCSGLSPDSLFMQCGERRSLHHRIGGKSRCCFTNSLSHFALIHVCEWRAFAGRLLIREYGCGKSYFIMDCIPYEREFDVKNPFPRTEGSTFSNDSQTKDVLRHSQSMCCDTHKACVATLTKPALRHPQSLRCL